MHMKRTRGNKRNTGNVSRVHKQQIVFRVTFHNSREKIYNQRGRKEYYYLELLTKIYFVLFFLNLKNMFLICFSRSLPSQPRKWNKITNVEEIDNNER